GAGTEGFEASAAMLGCGLCGWKEYRVDQVAATAISTAQTRAVVHRVLDENLWFIDATRPRAPRRRCGVTEALLSWVPRPTSETLSNCSLTAAANARHRSNLFSGCLARALKNTSSRCAKSGR